MTYYELFTKAENLLIRNKITLGEYDEMVQPLNEEVRKEGKWIDDDEINEKLGTYFAHCSQCGFQMDVHNNRGYFNFCPNCGARMF